MPLLWMNWPKLHPHVVEAAVLRADLESTRLEELREELRILRGEWEGFSARLGDQREATDGQLAVHYVRNCASGTAHAPSSPGFLAQPVALWRARCGWAFGHADFVFVLSEDVTEGTHRCKTCFPPGPDNRAAESSDSP